MLTGFVLLNQLTSFAQDATDEVCTSYGGVWFFKEKKETTFYKHNIKKNKSLFMYYIIFLAT